MRRLKFRYSSKEKRSYIPRNHANNAEIILLAYLKLIILNDRNESRKEIIGLILASMLLFNNLLLSSMLLFQRINVTFSTNESNNSTVLTIFY